MPPVTARDATVKTEGQFLMRFMRLGVVSNSIIGDASVPSSPLTATSSPLSEPPEESDTKDANKSTSRPRRSVRTGSAEHGHGKPL